MARAQGLFNPKNAAPDSGGGFREGLLNIVDAEISVVQRDARAGQEQELAHPALVLTGVQLDPDTQEPVTDGDGKPVKQVLNLGTGSKSLQFMHPGVADSPDSDDVEDQGTEVGATGNTIYMVKDDYRLHPKTGLMVFMGSLEAAGWKEEYLNRVWAPDFVGSTFFITTRLDPTGEKEKGPDGKERERTIPYKVVGKIIRAGYEGGGKAKTGKAAGKAAAGAAKGANGAATPASVAATAAGNGAGAGASVSADEGVVAALTPILMTLSEELSGQSVSVKALRTRVTKLLNTNNVNPKMHVPALQLVANPAWMEENGPMFDLTVAEGMVTFG